MSFWTDAKVNDSFTPEDRYFYLYLMTNPHTNLCGCYEIGERQMEIETGYNKKTLDKLIDRMCVVHEVIDYCKQTKEVLIANWYKYNWTTSEKFRKPLLAEIQRVKSEEFRDYLIDLCNGIYTVSIPYLYRMDTTVTVTDTDNNISTLSNINNSINNHININPKVTAYFPDCEVVDQCFKEYVAYRKEKKNPLTDHAIDLAIKNVKKFATKDGVFCADIAIAVIEQSIANGWTGLFPINDKQSKPVQQTKNKFNPQNERPFDKSIYEDAFAVSVRSS